MTIEPTSPAALAAALAGLAEPAPPALLDRVAADLRLGDEFVRVESPAGGALLVAFGRHGVSMVGVDDESAFRAAFARRYPDRPLRRALTPARAPAALRTTLSGKKATLRYDLSTCSPFQRAVLAKTAEIPRGEVRSYGWIAREIGHDDAVRAVGTALGRNPIPVLIPCHRVVRTDGHIGNYGLGTPMKVELLTVEGVDLDDLAKLAASGARYVGSATNDVFCVPTCAAARRIRPANRVTFRSEKQAAAAGYRPCARCRPAAPSTT
jgi:O-6-methylguanine DNA methyltransferase